MPPLLVCAALALGQLPEGEAPPPPPAPDRWLLMQELQGTWPGWLLDSHRTTVSGWTEGSYTASSSRAEQLPMGFNYEANQFLLQQNWLRVDCPVVTTGTTEPTFGFRSDTILPGADYRFTLPRGLADWQLRASDGKPNLNGFDPVQFYGEAYFPTIFRGLDIKVGRIFCQYGAEVIDAVPNQLASHAYTFIYNPFTHTGVMATAQLSPEWTVQAGAVLGPDVFFDPAASPYSMFSLKWAPPEGRDSVLISGLLGSGRYDVIEEFNNPNILDLVYIHAFNSRLSYTLDALYGWQKNVPDIGRTHWYGIVNYLTCRLSSRLSATARMEWFNDMDGNRTGFHGMYRAATLGLNIQPCKSIVLRPEIRRDYNADSTPYEGKHGLYTAAADVILRW